MTLENSAVEINSAQRIYFVRSLKVMLDGDLAELYQVPIKRLNEQTPRKPVALHA